MVTIEQQPTSPRYSQGDIVYSVSSDLIGPDVAVADLKLQYSFLMDIQVNGTSILSEPIRKHANPNGIGIFNIGKELDNDLIYALSGIGRAFDTFGTSGAKEYSILFGEEYIESGVLTQFDGDDNVGAPATSANDIFVIKGRSPLNSGSLTAADSVPRLLCHADTTQRVHRDDYVTVSEYVAATPSVIHHAIVLPSTGDTHTETIGGVVHTFNIYDDKSTLGELRLIGFNEIGGIEFFNLTEEGFNTTTLEKSTYTAAPISYTGSAPSNRSSQNALVIRGGETVYNIDYDTVYTKNTRWLSETDATVLQSIINSPIQLIQEGDDIVPINIMSGYDGYPNLRVQPNFNYQIAYRYAKQ